jgi:UDP-N-acetylmuramyl pentapeptide phosphotransferase/UDP-N-acetylglucosamine-1-phosphate transferase
MKLLRRILAAAAGAAAAQGTVHALPPAQGEDAPLPGTARLRDRLSRTNFKGRQVSMAGGPAMTLGASIGAAAGAPDVAAAAAVFTAGLGAGVVGRYDDVASTQPDQKAVKGFKGHLSALAHGDVTSGLVKLAGIGAAGLAAAALLEANRSGGPGRRLIRVLLGAGVIAGTANLYNLLDLRPGRALKAGLLVGLPLVAGRAGGMAAGALGASATLLPADLDEQLMLGDSGANALGAVLGTTIAAQTGIPGRAAVLAVVAGLTGASEKISFTKVIEDTPGLRELDTFGRRRD